MKNSLNEMKKTWFVLLFLLLPTMVSAQKIHWIIFGDTQDPNNGSEVRNSISAFTSQFIDRINDAIMPKGYVPQRRVFTGPEFTEGKCNDVIRKLSCGKDDIIVFYYLGHGGRAQLDNEEQQGVYNQKYPWPDLAFDKANTNQTIQGQTLNGIHRTLKQKGARLTVTMGMCCNKRSSQYKRHGTSTQSRRYKIVSKKFAKKVGQQLFLKSRGDVLISSAQPNEISYGGSYNGQDVDHFTSAICQTMDRYANNDIGENVTWNSFLNEVSSKCTSMANMQGEKQHPKKQVNTTLMK